MKKRTLYFLVCLLLILPIFWLVAKPFTKNISLKEIFQTVPVIKAKFGSLPAAHGAKPSFAGKFAKVAYSEDPVENIKVASAKLIGIDGKEIEVTEQVLFESKEGSINNNEK